MAKIESDWKSEVAQALAEDRRDRDREYAEALAVYQAAKKAEEAEARRKTAELEAAKEAEEAAARRKTAELEKEQASREATPPSKCRNAPVYFILTFPQSLVKEALRRRSRRRTRPTCECRSTPRSRGTSMSRSSPATTRYVSDLVRRS
jgi:hypothetical protein